jgi:hypothetical protein
MNQLMKLSLFALFSLCVACTSGGEKGGDVPAASEVAPTANSVPASASEPAAFPAALVEAAEALQKKPKQSYNTCLDFCVAVMGQAGQVTDECPRECREDGNRYTQSDLMTDDQDSGLMVSDDCLKPCVSAVDSKGESECRQGCCVASCELRQEYKGSGMGAECPAMCRDFLERTSGG